MEYDEPQRFKDHLNKKEPREKIDAFLTRRWIVPSTYQIYVLEEVFLT